MVLWSGSVVWISGLDLLRFLHQGAELYRRKQTTNWSCSSQTRQHKLLKPSWWPLLSGCVQRTYGQLITAQSHDVVYKSAVIGHSTVPSGMLQKWWRLVFTNNWINNGDDTGTSEFRPPVWTGCVLFTSGTGSPTDGEVSCCCCCWPLTRTGSRVWGPGSEALSGGEGGHLEWDPLPQLLGLFSSLEILQDIIELHHANRRQAERTTGAADDIHEVVVVGGGQMDEPVVDVLWAEGGQVQQVAKINSRRPAAAPVWTAAVQRRQTVNEKLHW